MIAIFVTPEQGYHEILENTPTNMFLLLIPIIVHGHLSSSGELVVLSIVNYGCE